MAACSRALIKYRLQLSNLPRENVLLPDLPLFQGSGMRRSRVPENSETVVNGGTRGSRVPKKTKQWYEAAFR